MSNNQDLRFRPVLMQWTKENEKVKKGDMLRVCTCQGFWQDLGGIMFIVKNPPKPPNQVIVLWIQFREKNIDVAPSFGLPQDPDNFGKI